MTTGLIQNGKEASGATLAGMALLRGVLDEVKALDKKTALLPAQPDQHDLEKDGWRRTLSATVALLGQAHKMIEDAEAVIRQQETRIARLEDLATTDELTGLKNRRGFLEIFTRELDRCNRNASAGGLLVLIDLDGFKAVNDFHGHLAGDACLRLVARTLTNEIRSMDAAARLGGDEFVLLLANTGADAASSRACAMARRLNNLAFAWHGDVIPVQASIGFNGYGRTDNAETVFNAADRHLYASKAVRKEERRNPQPRRSDS